MFAFGCRVVSRLYSQPDAKPWVNDWDLQTAEDTASVKAPELSQAAIAICNFHKKISFDDVYIVRAHIYTIAREIDSNTLGYKKVPFNQRGIRTHTLPNDALADLRFCQRIELNAEEGDGGSKFFRGVHSRLSIPGANNEPGAFEFFQGGQFRDIAIELFAEMPATVRIAIHHKYDDLIESENIASMSPGMLTTHQRTIKRVPKISMDPDAIRTRIAKVRKESALVEASMVVAASVTELEQLPQITSDFNAFKAEVAASNAPTAP